MADERQKTVLDGVIAIATAVEAQAVALMGAANALETLMDHVREESSIPTPGERVH